MSRRTGAQKLNTAPPRPGSTALLEQMETNKYITYAGIFLIALILLAGVFVYFGTPPEQRSDFFEPKSVCVCMNPETNTVYTDCECTYLGIDSTFKVEIEIE